MKICLLGGTGLLGSEFKRVLTSRGLNFVAPTREALDVTNASAVLSYVQYQKPDLIINGAAYTNVDGAEADKEACRALNVALLQTLVQTGVPLINFSSDYVFDAPAGMEIPEDYPRNPQSVYAQSKADGEALLEQSEIDWWNIRTSWLWGPGGKNFVSTIKQLAQGHSELRVIDDQIGRPTYAPDLAEFVVEHFVVSQIPGSRSRDQIPEPGHYHLQNQGEPVSWAGFAEYFLNKDGWNGTIKKISSAEFGAPAVRPVNSCLKNTRLKLGLKDWKNCL